MNLHIDRAIQSMLSSLKIMKEMNDKNSIEADFLSNFRKANKILDDLLCELEDV